MLRAMIRFRIALLGMLLLAVGCLGQDSKDAPSPVQSFSPVVDAHQEAPQLLLRAVHCLKVKEFFPRSSAAEWTFGYFLDENSYPHEKVIYVVRFASDTKRNGMVFTVFLTERATVQRFNIQNNATFVLSKGGDHGIEFTGEPLGGVWTHDHIVRAVNRIEKQPRFIISEKDLSAPTASTRCEAYTDPDR